MHSVYAGHVHWLLSQTRPLSVWFIPVSLVTEEDLHVSPYDYIHPLVCHMCSKGACCANCVYIDCSS